MVVLQPIKLGREMSRLVLRRGPIRRVLPLGRSNARNNLDLAESLLTISADEFTKKWNFDPVREVPIAGGRYCWRPAASSDPSITTTSDPTTEPKDKSAILVSKRARCHCDCGLVPRCCGCDCGSCTCRSSPGCPPSCTAGHTSSGSVMREFGKMVTSVNMTSVRSSLARAADGGAGVALHTSPTRLEDSVASTTTTKASLTTPETSLATAEAPGTTKGTSVTTTGTSLSTAGTSVTSTGTSVTTTGTSVTTSEASPTSTGASRTGSSVTTTGASLITSSGAVTTSGCAVTKSESATKMLATTVTAPVKAVTTASGAVTTASGAVTTPSGAATMPSSKVTSPSTAVTTLSIAVTQSGRAITKPSSAVTGCRDVTLRQTCITEFARPSKRRRLVKFHKGTTLHPPISAIV